MADEIRQTTHQSSGHAVYEDLHSSDDFQDAIRNSPYSFDITTEHIQVTTDIMAKTGVGRMAKPPLAQDWVRAKKIARLAATSSG